MARAAVTVNAGTSAASVVIAAPTSASIAVNQITQPSGAPGAAFPTSKTLRHPVTQITITNYHALQNAWVRTDGTMPTNGGAAGDIFVGAGKTVMLPVGSTSGSVTLRHIASGATTPLNAYLS